MFGANSSADKINTELQETGLDSYGNGEDYNTASLQPESTTLSIEQPFLAVGRQVGTKASIRSRNRCNHTSLDTNNYFHTLNRNSPYIRQNYRQMRITNALNRNAGGKKTGSSSLVDHNGGDDLVHIHQSVCTPGGVNQDTFAPSHDFTAVKLPSIHQQRRTRQRTTIL